MNTSRTATREVIATLADGSKVNATITRTGEVWSPLGAALTLDMIVSERPIEVDAWHERLRSIAAAANAPKRPSYGQAGRWS